MTRKLLAAVALVSRKLTKPLGSYCRAFVTLVAVVAMAGRKSRRLRSYWETIGKLLVVGLAGNRVIERPPLAVALAGKNSNFLYELNKTLPPPPSSASARWRIP